MARSREPTPSSSPPAPTNPETGDRYNILQFFAYDHLPPALQKVSAPFCELARAIAAPETGLPRNPERTVSLRKLLEAKDAAVRAFLAKE